MAAHPGSGSRVHFAYVGYCIATGVLDRPQQSAHAVEETALVGSHNEDRTGAGGAAVHTNIEPLRPDPTLNPLHRLVTGLPVPDLRQRHSEDGMLQIAIRRDFKSGVSHCALREPHSDAPVQVPLQEVYRHHLDVARISTVHHAGKRPAAVHECELFSSSRGLIASFIAAIATVPRTGRCPRGTLLSRHRSAPARCSCQDKSDQSHRLSTNRKPKPRWKPFGIVCAAARRSARTNGQVNAPHASR